MSKPKLALIPSGYKSGKVYSILPNDASGDFDFERQSIGTRVRKDGLIEEAKTVGSITNLVLNSEDFSTNWTNFNGASISTDQTLAPDGTNTADKIVSNGTNYSFTRPTSNITVTNAKYYTASIYVKADVETEGYLRCDYGTNIYNRKFDLSAGTLGTGFDNTGNIPEAESIEALPNGWYRVSMTDIVDTVSFEMRVYCVAGSASSGDSLFIWGAMVSEGALSDYIKTEGSQVTKRVETFTDVPRLDWYNSNCPSLLLEPQRTNNLKYSEDFTNAVWSLLSSGTGTNPVVTANYSIAPNGQLTADRIIFNQGSGTGSNDFSIIRQIVTSVGQGVSSVYMKSNTNDNYIIGIDEVGLGTKNVTVTPDWQRFDYSETTNDRLQLSLRGSTNSNYADISVWGAMMEAGTYPTSYIKTEASAVTRLFDNLESEASYTTGNDVTWFLDFETYTFENSFRPVMVVRNSGFTQTMDWISYNSGSDYYIRIRATNQSTLQTIIAFGEDAIQMFTRNKVAIRLYGSNFEIYVNGIREYTGTSNDGDWTILNNNAIFNDFGSNTERPSTKLYDFRVYDKTMTQSELEELTTL